jgi:putative ABC transport system ATP-binding protein
MSAICIHNLFFRYRTGDFRLQIPEFRVERSEKVAVIGPSGAGKTTLLNLVAGIVVPREGRVQVDDICVNELSEAERRKFRITSIGFVFQDFELIEYLTVKDNILHPFRITSALKLDRTVRAQATDLAQQMGIDGLLKRPVNKLSQGEKQRAAICRAMLPKPKLILADEATGNLDPDNKKHILDLLFKSVDEHDAALLAVTHDHELLDRFDRVVDFREFSDS